MSKASTNQGPQTFFQKVVKEGKSFTLIIFCVFLFRSVAFEPFRIPSGSMIPTLMIGDLILVNKMSYGFKVPFTEWFGDPVYITGPEQPKRGDVIVFKYPKDTSLNYIKRVVGMPGDFLEIKNKVVYINDTPIEMKEIDGKEIMSDMDEKFKDFKLKFYQAKTGDHQHVMQVHEDNYTNMDYPRTEIPKGQYFAMGDNRDFSADSRTWGFVPFEYIKGRAILVWFSFTYPFSEDGMKFRPWRIGKGIN